jgi:hypothetical protein
MKSLPQIKSYLLSEKERLITKYLKDTDEAKAERKREVIRREKEAEKIEDFNKDNKKKKLED